MLCQKTHPTPSNKKSLQLVLAGRRRATAYPTTRTPRAGGSNSANHSPPPVTWPAAVMLRKRAHSGTMADRRGNNTMLLLLLILYNCQVVSRGFNLTVHIRLIKVMLIFYGSPVLNPNLAGPRTMSNHRVNSVFTLVIGRFWDALRKRLRSMSIILSAVR
jgi:hypothetical protein